MSLPTTPPFTLAILAGGAGSRLGGVAKGLIELDGAPLIASQLKLAREMKAAVLVVTRDPSVYRRFEVPLCTDETPELGPAAGIVAGLRAARTERVLFTGCDMPWLSQAVLARLLQGAGEAPRCFEVEGAPQPLPSLWWRGTAEAVSKRVDRPLSLRWLLVLSGVERLPGAALREVDPDLRSLTSLNLPEELAAFGARLP